VLLVGAGGAAAGALGPLLAAGPRRVTVANRTLERAQALVQSHAALAALQKTELLAQSPQALEHDFDLIINATASSLAGAEVPVPARVLRPGSLAYDMMYGPAAAGLSRTGPAARRDAARRPGHAGGAGGRGLPSGAACARPAARCWPSCAR
jgi:shikimate 5-dehydrogenase